MATTRWTCVCALAVFLWSAPALEAATIFVAAGGDLQRALNEARPGDTILLQENAEFVGNFVLPVKSRDAWITIRSAAPDTVLPGAGVRIQPSHAPLLARLRSPNANAALRTAAGAHHWDIRYLDFPATQGGAGDILKIGDGSNAQSSLSQVPHHIVLNHIFVHGDPSVGQKRGIALNAASVTISDSYIAECKGIGQDTQAIGGWNGPGPYVIENNYLEAAGENVLFGGSDPSIPNLVADGITFRHNYLSRPMAWKNPLVPTPQAVTATATTGGSLPAGTYGYRVIARRAVGQTTARSTASVEVKVTITGAGGVRVRWQAVPGVNEYRVYGRTPGGESTYWTVTTTEYVDTGASGSSEAVPTSAGTLWTVKNIFELKNARNVVVSENILENHWKESQPGFAIVLTPRNSGGTCTWCGLENILFENNIVQNVGAGVNLIGYDSPSRPTRQTTNVSFTGNVFRLDTALGGNGRFLQIGEEPKNVTIQHNTVDSNGNALVYTYGGSATNPREIDGLSMEANASRHGSYGMNGQNFSYGSAILNAYYPGAVFSKNYLAGASLSRYPAGTLSAGLFHDQYVDAAAGDYTIRPGSILRGGAPDGTDIGVDFPALKGKTKGVVPGIMDPQPSPQPPSPDFTLDCTFLTCTFTDASTSGSGAIVSRSWTFGDGTPVLNDATAGVHVYTAAGTYQVTLLVTDGNGLSATASTQVAVAPPNVAPVPAFTPNCVDLTCTFTDNSTDADGHVAGWEWSFGASSSTLQSPAFSFATPGTYTVTLTVTDDDGAQAAVAMPVQVTGVLHASYSGSTLKWSNASGSTNYWNADVTVAIHGANERLVPGATVTAAWTGAVAKTVSCVTNASGLCVLKSGTLSYGRSTVTLTVTSVTAPDRAFNSAASHDATKLTPGFTLLRP